MLSNMTSVAALGNRNMTECFEVTCEGPASHPEREWGLRTFARKFSNIDFFLRILPLKDDELVMSEM